VAEMLASLPPPLHPPQLWGGKREGEEATEAEVKVFRPAEGEKAFTITWEDGAWQVRGAEIERVGAMTNWDLDEAVQRFQRIAEAMGLKAALREAGVQPGDTVRIGEIELEWQ